MSNVTRYESIYTLQRPVWFDAAGMSKGLDFDRQHLGFILDAGQTLTIRQVTAAFITALTLRLLTADGKTAAQFSVGSDWVQASAREASVPFIDTPYTDGEPVVEFHYTNTSKTLPVYRRGDQETAFYEHWDNQDAEFALINSDYVDILVPKHSKEDLKSRKKGQKAGANNIDEIIDHYDSIFNFYNGLTGIAFEAESDTDLNIKNKYFITANRNVSAESYYGNIWTAKSNDSVSSYWLTPEADNWDSLNEIAQEYQGHFVKDKYFSVGEVWSKVYAVCYQDIMLGENKYQDGWLYNAGVTENIVNLIDQGIPLNKWDEHSKVFFIKLMIDKAGVNAFTHFNKEYRKNSNNQSFMPYEHALLDMLSASFAAAGEQVDVTPFIQLAGGFLTHGQQKHNAFSHAKAVYPLNQLVDAKNLEAVMKQLKLDSTMQLVDVTQLKITDLKGNVTLRFNIDDFTQILGEDLILMVGTNYGFKAQINTITMTLGELPIGVYTLRLPTGRDQKYHITPGYLVVKQGDNAIDINFVKRDSSPIISQEINLLGLSDDLIATVMVDHDKGVVVIETTKTTPHYCFANSVYAKIIVRDTKNAVIFSKVIHGDQAEQSVNELPFVAGFKVEIHHEEPSRVRLNPMQSNVIDTKNKFNVLLITRTGLKNVALKGNPEEALLERIENAVQHLQDFRPAFFAPFSIFKDDIYLALNIFDSPKREYLLSNYQNYIPADNTHPSTNVGNGFTIAFKGLYDHLFMTGTLDLVSKTFTVAIEAGLAHYRFNVSDGNYAFVSYTDAYGKLLYNYGVIGNKNQEASSVVLPVSGNGGEVIQVYHQEPRWRLVITNDMQHVRIAAETAVQMYSYRITKLGLERIADDNV